MTKYDIKNLTLSGDMRPALAECYLHIGPIRIRATLTQQGKLGVSDTLWDGPLRAEIAIEFRRIALEKLTEIWRENDEQDRKIIAKKVES